jgi:Icc protein
MGTIIAHVSDAHVLSHRKNSFGTHFVSIGRPLDIAARSERAWRAFSSARAVGARHLIVSGDLTEMGEPEEFEVFAEALALSGFQPEEVTLVPGNHDRYGPPDAWTKALEGPLAAYRQNAPDAATGEGARLIDLGDLRLLALDATRPQPFTRSAGFFEAATLEALASLLADDSMLRTPLAVVQHHPPYARSPLMQWIDGLENWAREAALFERAPNAQILHGHIHRSEDRLLCGRPMGILGVAALVDDSAHVRLFEATSNGLVPCAMQTIATTTGASAAA